MKLNVGCGCDYRQGFINIDGSDKLPKVDKVMEINAKSLLKEFDPDVMTHIVCKDIIEHYHHWEGVAMMEACYTILKPGGTLWIQVPNTKAIIESNLPIGRKIRYLYGNQDVNGPGIPYSETRNKFPQFHCHKYGWAPGSLKNELERIGFTKVWTRPEGVNFVASCKK